MSERQRTTIPRPPVHRIAIVQLLVAIIAFCALWFFMPAIAVAVLAGAMIELLGRAYFAFFAFRFAGAQQMRLVVNAFRRGESGKFVLVVVLFGALFSLKPGLSPVAVFVGYLASWLLGTLLGMRLVK
ncbi:MAG TPA: ATP synthase subunit I [Pseudomonadales bacterium]|nr:ATP synthase subunit I [Pseudomonadales bacterium]